MDKKYRNDVDALYRNVLRNEKVLSFLLYHLPHHWAMYFFIFCSITGSSQGV